MHKLRIRADVEARRDGKYIAELWVEHWVNGVCVEARCYDDQNDPYPTHEAALERAHELKHSIMLTMNQQGD